MLESGLAFLFLWNQLESCEINLGCDFIIRRKKRLRLHQLRTSIIDNLLFVTVLIKLLESPFISLAKRCNAWETHSWEEQQSRGCDLHPLKTWPDLLCLDVSFLFSLGLVSADWSRNPLTEPPGRCLGQSLRATFHWSSYGERSRNAAELPAHKMWKCAKIQKDITIAIKLSGKH